MRSPGASAADTQADFVVWADIRRAILKAGHHRQGPAVLLHRDLKTRAVKQQGGTLLVGDERGQEALRVEEADWQRYYRSVAEETPLQR